MLYYVFIFIFILSDVSPGRERLQLRMGRSRGLPEELVQPNFYFIIGRVFSPHASTISCANQPGL